MKTPDQLREQLKRQWENTSLRVDRLLGNASWPLSLSIGKPTAGEMASDARGIKATIDLWRGMQTGKVSWRAEKYRALAAPIELPAQWTLSEPAQWVSAIADRSISIEYKRYRHLFANISPLWHELLLRRRHLITSLDDAEIIRAAEVALTLKPGSANGAPLRSLSVRGIDSKFLERNRTLVTRMLDVRFDGEPGEVGLETFLDATQEGKHWLLVVDLDGNLLPFPRIRVRDADLEAHAVTGSAIVIVENEQCVHLLPQLPGTVAVLGAGLNLNWLQGAWLKDRRIAYWGDIDSWGLAMLGTARRYQPSVTSILMDGATFAEFDSAAVAEEVTYGEQIPDGLSPREGRLYGEIVSRARGRLEQEFLPAHRVHAALQRWHSDR